MGQDLQLDLWGQITSTCSSYFGGLKPNPSIGIAENAERHLYLVSGKNPFPGLVDFKKTPYLYDILKALEPDNGIEQVVLMKGWQTGGTLTALSWMLWVMNISPSPMLIVQPNDELRAKFSKQRIDPIVANCEDLQGKISELQSYGKDKKQKDTIITKMFPGGFLNLGTSKAAVSLRSDSIQNIVFDEMSAYDDDCQGEGDPCSIALGRTSAYEGRKKIFYISTPKIKGSCHIERVFNTTDKRHYFIKCLACSHYQTIKWRQIDFSSGTAQLKCEKCPQTYFEEDKTALLASGEWRATVPDPSKGKSAGYHLPALLAPPGFYSWNAAVEQFKKGKSNPKELKVFINNVLAETFKEDSYEELEPNDVRRLKEDYSTQNLPQSVGLITCGVDVHPKHLDLITRGWGRGQESWILDHVVLYGDADKETTWDRLYSLLQKTYTHHTGIKLNIAATCVDTGGANTQAAYDFVGNLFHENIIAIKGAPGAYAPIIGKPSTNNDSGIFLFPVGKNNTHSRLYSTLTRSIKRMELVKKKSPDNEIVSYQGPGIMHFHNGLEDHFFKELTAPRAKWKRVQGTLTKAFETTDGVADHAHDCVRYSDAAFYYLNYNIDTLCEELDSSRPEEEEEKADENE